MHTYTYINNYILYPSVQRLKEEIGKCGEKISALREDKCKRETQIDSLKGDLSVAEERQVELRHALRCSQSEEAWLKRENQSLKDDIQSVNTTVSKMEIERRELMDGRAMMQQMLNERNKIVQQQSERMDQMQRRRVGLEQSVKSLTLALQALAGEQQKQLGIPPATNTHGISGGAIQTSNTMGIPASNTSITSNANAATVLSGTIDTPAILGSYNLMSSNQSGANHRSAVLSSRTTSLEPVDSDHSRVRISVTFAHCITVIKHISSFEMSASFLSNFS